MDVAAINDMVATQFPGSTTTCAELGEGYALAQLVVSDDTIRPGGYVSGPTQFAIADSALWYATFLAIGRIEPMALTSEMSIRFLRPAQGSILWARGTIDTATRSKVVGSVTIWTDDHEARPSSIAQGTYVLPKS